MTVQHADNAGAPSTQSPAVTDRDVASRVLNEATLVARVQDGDISAFEQLVRSYQAELFRLAYRMLHDRGDAQDAVQDTFTLAWRKLPTLTDTQAFRGWIYQIATRTCLHLIRTRTRRRTDLTDGEANTLDAHAAVSAVGDEPADMAQTAANFRDLDTVLSQLPPEQRACWVLKELHGLSYPQIAFATGVPVSTVRGRLARARTTLTEKMAPWR